MTLKFETIFRQIFREHFRGSPHEDDTENVDFIGILMCIFVSALVCIFVSTLVEVSVGQISRSPALCFSRFCWGFPPFAGYKQQLETFLASTLCRESGRVMRTLMTILGKMHRDPS